MKIMLVNRFHATTTDINIGASVTMLMTARTRKKIREARCRTEPKTWKTPARSKSNEKM